MHGGLHYHNGFQQEEARWLPFGILEIGKLTSGSLAKVSVRGEQTMNGSRHARFRSLVLASAVVCLRCQLANDSRSAVEKQTEANSNPAHSNSIRFELLLAGQTPVQSKETD